jgi:hypothetical protein
MTQQFPDPRWQRTALDTWLLGCDAAIVIWLRLGKLAMGDAAAAREARLMVNEKVEAMMALQWQAMTGALGATPQTAARRSVNHYRKAVSANRRRLSR